MISEALQLGQELLTAIRELISELRKHREHAQR
jgi:hypothetical protein